MDSIKRLNIVIQKQSTYICHTKIDIKKNQGDINR